MKRKLISFAAAIIMVFAVSFSVFAAGSLTVKDVSAKTGDVFTVEVNLSGNPGIIATRIIIDYDTKYLTLQKAENGEVFSSSNALFGKDYSESPYKMLWDDALGTNITTNGKLAVLTFKVKAEAPEGKTNIKITVDGSSTFDENLKEKSIADAECTVSFPTVSKTEKETTKASTTQKSDVSTSKTTEKNTEKTTEKKMTEQTKASTTKPKPPVISPTTPTATQMQEEVLGTKASATEKTTAKTEDKTGTTTELSELPTKDEQGISEPETNGTSNFVTENISDTQAQIEDETEIFEKEESKSGKQYLWFLLIVPVAAAVIILIRNKKVGNKNVK